jgi:hypothetical protein
VLDIFSRGAEIRPSACDDIRQKPINVHVESEKISLAETSLHQVLANQVSKVQLLQTPSHIKRRVDQEQPSKGCMPIGASEDKSTDEIGCQQGDLTVRPFLSDPG